MRVGGGWIRGKKGPKEYEHPRWTAAATTTTIDVASGSGGGNGRGKGDGVDKWTAGNRGAGIRLLFKGVYHWRICTKRKNLQARRTPRDGNNDPNNHDDKIYKCLFAENAGKYTLKRRVVFVRVLYYTRWNFDLTSIESDSMKKLVLIRLYHRIK